MNMKKLLGGLLAATILAVPATIIPTSKGWGQVEVITVTSRRREETLQDIPLSVTAFGEIDIEQKGITNVRDIAKLTSGLTFDLGFAPQDTRPTIRGIPSTRGRPPTGILVDGTDVSSESLQTAGGSMLMNLRLADIERVEVVKGPQSALYGRTAFNGAINYVTRQPGDEFSADLSGDFGNHNRLIVKGGVEGPVLQDLLNVRVYGAWGRDDGGNFRNTVTGEKINGWEGWGANMSAVFTPTETLEFIARVAYAEDEYESRAVSTYSFANGSAVRIPVPVIANEAGVTTSTSASAPPIGTLVHPAPITLSPDPLRPGYQDFRGSTLDTVMANVRATWDGDLFDIKSWTAYTHGESIQEVDTDRIGLPGVPCGTGCIPGGSGSGVPFSLSAGLIDATDLIEPLAPGAPFSGASTLRQNIETDIFSQELRFENFDEENMLRWAVGGLFWTEDHDQTDQNTAAIFINVAGLLGGIGSEFANTRLIAAGHPGFRAIGRTGENELVAGSLAPKPAMRKTDHYSLYGTFEWDAIDNLTLGFEGRYNWEDYDVLFSELDPVQATLIPFGSFGAPGTPPIGHDTNGGPPFYLASGPNAKAFGTVFTAGTTADESWFSWRTYVEYDATDWFSGCGCDDLLSYVSVAQGVKPGGLSSLNFDRELSLEQLVFLPENLRVYEGGLKSSWFDGQIIANLSAGYQKYTDKVNTQQAVLPGAASLQTVVRNDGEGRVYFIEFDGAYAPNQAVLGGSVVFNASYTYLNTEYTGFIVEATQSANDIARGGNCTPFVSDLPGGTGNTNFCKVSLNGNRFERQPKHGVVGSVNFTRPLMGAIDLLAALDIQWTGERFLTHWNRWTLESYVNVDARIGLQSDNWSVIVYGENLTDDDTVRSAQENFDLFSFGTAVATFHTRPTQFGVRLGMNL